MVHKLGTTEVPFFVPKHFTYVRRIPAVHFKPLVEHSSNDTLPLSAEILCLSLEGFVEEKSKGERYRVSGALLG